MHWPKAYLDALLEGAPQTIACESDRAASGLRRALLRRRKAREMQGIEIALRDDIVHIRKINPPLILGAQP